MNERRQMACPLPDAWVEFVAGTCSSETAEVLCAHAEGCDVCSDRLRSLLSMDQPHLELDPITASVLQDSSWQTAMADRMAHPPAGAKRFTRQWYWAAAAVVLLGLVGWLLVTQRTPDSLELLAHAYTEQRQMELRVPGSVYAPLRINKGSGRTIDSVPASLLEAELKLKRELANNPENPAALHAKARSELLSLRADEALRSFQAAADLGLATPDFLIDYASAYYLRAERNGSPIDYSSALEKLGEALRLQPSHSAALFNRAIVFGKLGQYLPAIEDLEKLIVIERDEGWRREAEDLLRQLRQRHSKVFEARNETSPLPESGLEAAMTHGIEAGDPAARASAAVLLKEHGEDWLIQILALPRSAHTDTFRALSALARLRVASSASDEWLPLAAGLRRSPLPAPLALWLEYETLHRLSRSRGVGGCGASADLVRRAAPYPWFAAQLDLDSSLCAAGRLDFAAAEKLMNRAEQVAKRHRLLQTELRCINYRAQRFADNGYYREAFRLAHAGLQRMESGDYPLRRAYDFHSILLRSSAQLRRPHSAFGAAVMMSAVSVRSGMPMFEMIARAQVANFASQLGFSADTKREYALASQLAGRLGSSADVQNYWRQTRIGLMEAIHDLRGLRELRHQATSTNTYFDRSLVAALCREEFRQGEFAAADQLAATYLDQLVPLAVGPKTSLRTYRTDLMAIGRTAIAAKVALGRTTEALALKDKLDLIDRRLLNGSAEIRKTPPIPANTALVDVEALGGRVAVWTRTADSILFHWAPGLNELSALARRLNRSTSLAGSDPAPLFAAARTFHNALLPNVPVTSSRVYVRASREFANLPLSLVAIASPVPKRWLSYLTYHDGPPASVAGADEVQFVAADRPGTAHFDLAPLNRTIDEEVNSVSNAYPRAKLIRGTFATARALDQAIQEPGTFHFSGHAARWRDGVALLVAPDPFGETSEQREGLWTIGPSRPIRAHLVVFSACSTALIGAPDSVTPDHLAQAVLLAGGEHVIATLWDVDGEATAQWMAAFYGARGRGASLPDAFQAASHSLRQSTKWRHPRHWAAFSMYHRSIPVV